MAHNKKNKTQRRLINQRCRVRKRRTDYSLGEKSPYWEVFQESETENIEAYEALAKGTIFDDEDEEEDNIKQAQWEAVEGSFDSLSVKQRLVLDAIQNGGYISLDELAERLKMTRRTFRTHLARAIQKVKKFYRRSNKP